MTVKSGRRTISAVHETSARKAKRLLNFWPPFLGAGIRVVEARQDFLLLKVRLRQYPLNRNAFGTHFGGSIYSMTDPFFALMISHHLGREFAVWDKAAEIDFVIPGKGDLFATFALNLAVIDELRAEAADSAKVLRWFEVDVVDRDAQVVARVRKQIYVRRRR